MYIVMGITVGEERRKYYIEKALKGNGEWQATLVSNQQRTQMVNHPLIYIIDYT